MSSDTLALFTVVDVIPRHMFRCRGCVFASTPRSTSRVHVCKSSPLSRLWLVKGKLSPLSPTPFSDHYINRERPSRYPASDCRNRLVLPPLIPRTRSTTHWYSGPAFFCSDEKPHGVGPPQLGSSPLNMYTKTVLTVVELASRIHNDLNLRLWKVSKRRWLRLSSAVPCVHLIIILFSAHTHFVDLLIWLMPFDSESCLLSSMGSNRSSCRCTAQLSYHNSDLMVELTMVKFPAIPLSGKLIIVGTESVRSYLTKVLLSILVLCFSHSGGTCHITSNCFVSWRMSP